MNLSHLRYFVELAHTRHYTRAAEHLFITQPSLSHAIGQLESELGVPLLRAQRPQHHSHPAGGGVSGVRGAHPLHLGLRVSPCGAAPRGRG